MVEELISQYLRCIRQHAEDKIKEAAINIQPLFKNMLREYIITVPAMWPEQAHETTLKCAKAAGMGTQFSPVKVITEPEAAGIYALDSMADEMSLEVGDTFVICDAGGGYVIN
jgi:molecular chaperone DnaK (HSP70)